MLQHWCVIFLLMYISEFLTPFLWSLHLPNNHLICLEKKTSDFQQHLDWVSMASGQSKSGSHKCSPMFIWWPTGINQRTVQLSVGTWQILYFFRLCPWQLGSISKQFVKGTKKPQSLTRVLSLSPSCGIMSSHWHEKYLLEIIPWMVFTIFGRITCYSTSLRIFHLAV